MNARQGSRAGKARSGLIIFCLLTNIVFSAELNTLIRLPAAPSQLAAHGLMLDVVNTGSRLIAVGERGHILRSDDDGRSWTQCTVPCSVTLTAVCFPSEQKGWAVGHEGVILHTSDGGESWNLQLDGTEAMESIHRHVETMLDQKGSASNEELDQLHYLKRDAANALEEGPGRPFLEIWFKNEKNGFAVGAFGLLFITEDGGTTWTPKILPTANPDAYHFYAIAPSGEALLLAGEAGMILRSQDQGDSWEHISTPHYASIFGLIGGPRNKAAVAFGLRGTLLRSLDNGLSWEKIDTPFESSITDARRRKNGMLALATRSALWELNVGNTQHPASGQPIRPGGVAIETTNDGTLIMVGHNGIHRLSEQE